MIALVAACGGSSDEAASPVEVADDETATDEVVTDEVSSDESTDAAPEEATDTEAATDNDSAATAAVAANVEITLLDPLDGVLNSYCLDISGGNESVDPANGLQAHTCYSYDGDLGTDQVFDTARFASNALYMPIYDVCGEVSEIASGATIGLATCDGSDLQTFEFGATGTISPASDTSLCFTADAETRTGRSSDHQLTDLSLATCSDDLAAYQEWGFRASLDDEISLLAS